MKKIIKIILFISISTLEIQSSNATECNLNSKDIDHVLTYCNKETSINDIQPKNSTIENLSLVWMIRENCPEFSPDLFNHIREEQRQSLWISSCFKPEHIDEMIDLFLNEEYLSEQSESFAVAMENIRNSVPGDHLNVANIDSTLLPALLEYQLSLGKNYPTWPLEAWEGLRQNPHSMMPLIYRAVDLGQVPVLNFVEAQSHLHEDKVVWSHFLKALFYSGSEMRAESLLRKIDHLLISVKDGIDGEPALSMYISKIYTEYLQQKNAFAAFNRGGGDATGGSNQNIPNAPDIPKTATGNVPKPPPLPSGTGQTVQNKKRATVQANNNAGEPIKNKGHLNKKSNLKTQPQGLLNDIAKGVQLKKTDPNAFGQEKKKDEGLAAAMAEKITDIGESTLSSSSSNAWESESSDVYEATVKKQSQTTNQTGNAGKTNDVQKTEVIEKQAEKLNDAKNTLDKVNDNLDDDLESRLKSALEKNREAIIGDDSDDECWSSDCESSNED